MSIFASATHPCLPKPHACSSRQVMTAQVVSRCRWQPAGLSAAPQHTCIFAHQACGCPQHADTSQLKCLLDCCLSRPSCGTTHRRVCTLPPWLTSRLERHGAAKWCELWEQICWCAWQPGRHRPRRTSSAKSSASSFPSWPLSALDSATSLPTCSGYVRCSYLSYRCLPAVMQLHLLFCRLCVHPADYPHRQILCFYCPRMSIHTKGSVEPALLYAGQMARACTAAGYMCVSLICCRVFAHILSSAKQLFLCSSTAVTSVPCLGHALCLSCT